MVILTIDNNAHDHPGCDVIERDGWVFVVKEDGRLVTSFFKEMIKPDGIVWREAFSGGSVESFSRDMFGGGL